MGVRKNQAGLTADERQAFAAAVLALKNSVPSQRGLQNRYDDYVQWHMDSMMTAPGWAHGRPASLPWHREMLRRFELDLQTVDPSVTLPYWDWTTDQARDSGTAGSPWTDEFLGGSGDPSDDDKVASGPFAFASGKWTLNVTMGSDPDYLQRSLANDQAPTLPTPANVQGALATLPYDAPPWSQASQPSFRNRLEGWYGAGSVHNRVHLWVGGTMTGMCSPNDPIFFLHHANIDRLWAQWQQMHPDLSYLPTSTGVKALKGQELNDPMQPWGVAPAALLDHRVLGYSYDDEPAPVPEGEQLTHRIFLPGIEGVPATPSSPALSAPPQTQAGAHGGHGMPMGGHMFELSPEDKAAGGHDEGTGLPPEPQHGAAPCGEPAGTVQEQARTRLPMPELSAGKTSAAEPGNKPAFELSPEDRAAGGHDRGL